MSTYPALIGVLDIQGSVEEHMAVLKKLGVVPIAVKTEADLEKITGLIMPGGESTTIWKLMKQYKLDRIIQKRVVRRSLTIWGTCAGAILLAKLGLIGTEIKRNAYGRQIDSFETDLDIPALGVKKISSIFIRAPIVKKASPKVQILAEYAGTPVMLQQENILATMFHPELTRDTRVHKYFLALVKHYASRKRKT